MKQNYCKPIAKIYRIKVEGMIAQSPINVNTNPVDAGVSLSNYNFFYNSDWEE